MLSTARPRTSGVGAAGGGPLRAGSRPSSRPGTGIRWKRAPTAPSVPSRHSAFGYEEDGDGRLVLNEAPEDRRPRPDGPGPMDYAGQADWARQASRSRATTAYARDRSSRSDLARATGGLATPGPGAYVLPGLGSAAAAGSAMGVLVAGPGGAVFDRGSASSGPTAAFRSGTAKGEAMRNRATDFVPGPGAHYNARTMSAVRAKPRPPAALQNFGSTTGRSGVGSSTQTPGPIYNLPGAMRMRGSAARHDGGGEGPRRSHSSARARRAGGRAGAEAGAAGRRGFAVGQARFRDPDAARRTAVPGAGHYSVPDGFRAPEAPANARRVGTMTTGRRSAMGGGSTVLGNDGRKRPAPGPGQYRPGGFASVHREIEDARPLSTFSSAVRRPAPGSLRPERIDQTAEEAEAKMVGDYRSEVGPGSYSVSPEWRSSVSFSRGAHEGRGMASSGPERFARGGITDSGAGSAPSGIGPGSYDIAGAVSRGGRSPVAETRPSRGPRTARFAERPPSAPQPGPGQYDTRPGWSTRSYNVTVAEQELLRAAKGL